MLDPAIQMFLSERKEAWLKKNVKASMPKEKVNELEQECNEFYSLENWIVFAENNSIKRALASHPSKFSHPDVGASATNIKKRNFVSPVIYLGSRINDGFFRTGNVQQMNLDSTGNGTEVGAIGEIGAFLSLVLEGGGRLFEHIQNDSDKAKAIFNFSSSSYDEFKNGLLSMIKITTPQTSSKIKQVYFPVADDYHQLSLLTNSGMVYELRSRLDKLRFSEDVKNLRDKKRKNEFSEQGYSEIYGLTTIGYGGTKPQNISVLNNQNGGKAHLLLSLPPSIEKRNIHFPKSDFFVESFQQYEYADIFKALHKLFQTDHNNINIRDARDRYLQQVIDLIIEKMWAVRAVSQAQFHEDTSNLSGHQRTWLRSELTDQRENETQWLDTLVNEISRWFSRRYEKVLGKHAIKLGEEERLLFAHYVEQNKEFLL